MKWRFDILHVFPIVIPKSRKLDQYFATVKYLSKPIIPCYAYCNIVEGFISTCGMLLFTDCSTYKLRYRPQPGQTCDYRKGDLPRKTNGNLLPIFVVHLCNTAVKMIIVAPSIQIYPDDKSNFMNPVVATLAFSHEHALGIKVQLKHLCA